MTIDEMIDRLNEIKAANIEPEVPNFDPGTLEIRVQDEDGTYESSINSVEQLNDVWLIVDTPNYDPI